MSNPRVETLVAKLEKGHRKTLEVFQSIGLSTWQTIIYTEPLTWTMRDLLAHFVSSEEKLLLLAQDVASGGKGIISGFDFDSFNAEEQMRLKDKPFQILLADLCKAREATLDWVRSLNDNQLDNIGRHPVLGEVTLETIITAIYGHQLLHVREVQSKI